MKKILAILAIGTLVVTGCQSTNNPNETSTGYLNDHTGINYNTGIDSYEAATGYPNPLPPPPDSLEPEY